MPLIIEPILLEQEYVVVIYSVSVIVALILFFAGAFLTTTVKGIKSLFQNAYEVRFAKGLILVAKVEYTHFNEQFFLSPKVPAKKLTSVVFQTAWLTFLM
jgi:hypothetical protein